ncbi:penicillin-binding protein 2A [Heyndrickxia sporothermodurans]|nr:penicillin-binding protein 2A [Heyndrickxia sporothermodurans]
MTEKYQTREERKKQQGAVKNKKTKKKGKKGSIFKRIILTIFIIGVIGFLAGVGTFAYYASKAPHLNKKQLQDPIASEVLSMDNKVVGKIGSGKRDYITYNKIPDLVKDAIIATEDSRFFKHHGIDPIRLGGAVVANFKRGFGSEGASTITQQVVKMSFLSDKKTLERKAQEAWLSVKLEREYTKEEIFEMYVNKIYMSDGIHGIQTASKHYYNKTLDKLKLPQIALIAGLQQSPNNYNPFDHPDRAEKRRNVVLGLMYQHKKITKQEMEDAKKVPITKGLVKKKDRDNIVQYKYDAFMDLVIKEVEKLGYNPFSDGLKIYTTIDPDAQEYTEKILNTNEIVQYPDNVFQAGITLLDTKTGEIRAVGGARNPKVQRGLNRAVDIKRSPGSTIKPILDYGPAINYLQWSTSHQIVDEPYHYINNGPELNNWDNRHWGQMSIRKALYTSRNVPAAKAWAEVGPKNTREFANNLGLDLKENEMVPSSAIGGGLQMSPMKMAGAYSAFGNNGIYNTPHTVRKIVLADGETVVKTNPEPKIAMQDYTAYMVTDMLKDVLTKPQATGTMAHIPGLPVAGKTGTTNFSDDDVREYGIPSGASPDSWFAGYTTNYTAAVWTGYDSSFDKNGNFKYYLTPNEQKISQLIFKNLMAHVSEGKNTPDFEMPKSVVKVPMEVGTNLKASAYTPSDKIVYELFVRGHDVPQQVSTKYNVLESPTKLNGTYNPDTNEITVNWDHPKLKEGVSFDIAASFNNEGKQSLGNTRDTTLTISNPKLNGTYRIEVTAVLGDQRSKPASITITVKDPNSEEKDKNKDKENEKDKDKDKDKDSGNDNNAGENGQGNDKGNGNGHDNGNDKGNDKGNGQDNGSEPPDNGDGDGGQTNPGDNEQP